MEQEITVYGDRITEYIPQREPFVMIDGFVCGNSGFRSEFLIREGNVFLDGGRFSVQGVMEHQAQSAAALIGLKNRQSGEKVRIGVIGSVNGFSISHEPEQGQTLFSEVGIVASLDDLIMVSVKTFCSKGNDADFRSAGPLAECRMKLSLI